jgi:hypothetical protein
LDNAVSASSGEAREFLQAALSGGEPSKPPAPPLEAAVREHVDCEVAGLDAACLHSPPPDAPGCRGRLMKEDALEGMVAALEAKARGLMK